MNYPLISEYIEAIKLAEENFEQLNHLRPILNDDGEPVMSSGNFAVVFKMKDEQTGKLHAVKCFLKEQEGRAEAYHMIAEELEYVNSTFLTPIKYLEKELFVDSKNSEETEFPVLLMDWVEGMTLDKYIREHIDDQYELSLLAYQFSRLAMWLMPQPFAHGDLKPDNILVKDDGTLVLVDYDGMYVPAMKGQKARELGSPDFRHPSRTEDDFDEHIDDFSLASILLSLKAIALQPSLLDKYGASDCLLFSEKDYQNLSDSVVLGALQHLMQDAELATLYSLFILALSQNNLSQVSFRLFNLKRPDKSQYEEENLSTIVTDEDLANAWTDEYGVEYSADRKRLLRVNDNLTSYSIREGTKVICDESFSYDFGNGYIKSIDIPNTVVIIGYAAFRDCEVLSQINLPNSLKEIGESAFSGCKALKHISLPKSLVKIGDGAFNYCSSLDSLILPPSFETIGSKTFCGCKSLTYVKIPDLVVEIGNFAFSGCINLAKIDLPNSLQSIGNSAFYNCHSLSYISIPLSVKKIGDEAFAYCDSINHIIIPDSVIQIGENPFLGCENIDVDCCFFKQGAFYSSDFTRLISYIPNGLSTFNIPNTVLNVDDYAFYYAENLTQIIIPNSVRRIGRWAFSGCKSLRTIVIPESVSQIEIFAFADCMRLEEITILATEIKISRFAFKGCGLRLKIKIPQGTKAKFEEMLHPPFNNKFKFKFVEKDFTNSV